MLVHAQSRRVAIAERDVDRAVGPNDGMRPLVLITRVRIGLAAECRACASVATADLDACRPRRTTVSRLAEVYRAVAWNTRGRTAGCVEPCPRGVDAVLLRTRIARIGDDEFLVVEDVRIVVVGDNAKRNVPVLLERKRRRRVIERAADLRVRLRDDKGAVGIGADHKQHATDVGVAVRVERRRRIAACVERGYVTINELVEGRHHVAPGLAAVERERVAELVEPEARIVLPGDKVVGVYRIDRDHDGHYPCEHLHPLYVGLSLPIFRHPDVR